MNQTTLDEKLNLQDKLLEKHQVFSNSHLNFKYGISNIFKKVSSTTLIVTVIFTIIVQIIISKSDIKLNVNAQTQDIINISEITNELSNNNEKIVEVQKLNADFNDRQINYFKDEEKINELSPQTDVLVNYKETLKLKIQEKVAENQRLEEERIAQEKEKQRIEEEARIKREQEAERKAAEEAAAALARKKSVSSSTISSSSSVTPAQPISTQSITGTKFDWMTEAGISESDHKYVDFIISKESGWRHTVWNTSGSSAYGLCQSLPATKMASAGDDYMTNPVTQLKWCNGYAQQRYGGWANAYSFWSVNKWW